MPDPIEVARPAAAAPAQQEAFRKFILQMQDDRKLGLGAPRKGGDGFENFRTLDFRQDRSDEYFANTEEISWLQSRRSQAEAKLKPEEKDELRHIRRNYSAAGTEEERAKCRQAMEKLMPGTAELTGKIGKLVGALDSIPTMKEIPDPKACIRCHPRQGPTHFDPNARERQHLKASAVESFYQPRKEDQFEAVWAKNALESPIVKINEALKHLPPTKIESQDPAKLVRMALTMSGVELDHVSAKLVDKAVAGIKHISKVSGDKLVIDRDGTVDLPFPEKRELAAGIKLSSIEVGAVSMTLGEGKYPRTGGWEKSSNEFRAAISVAAAYDLPTLDWGVLWAPPGVSPDEARAQASPNRHVAKNSKPLLILHSDNDKSVPIANALIMIEALQKAGAKHVFHRYPEMGHMGINQEVIEKSRAFIEEISANRSGQKVNAQLRRADTTGRQSWFKRKNRGSR